MNRQTINQAKEMPPKLMPSNCKLLQRKCDKCHGKQLLQRSPIDRSTHSTMPDIVPEVLRSPGQPLDSNSRAFFEPRLGHDFSQVRVHKDAKAAESARAVGALAYTIGQQIVFGAGQFAPGTPSGDRLLSHELAHVVQQTDLKNINEMQRSVISFGQTGDTYEREAEQAEDNILFNHPRIERRSPHPILSRSSGQAIVPALGKGHIAGVQFYPAAVSGTRVEPVSGGALNPNDFNASRLSVIIGRGTTVRGLARILLPLWNNAIPFVPPESQTPLQMIPLTSDELAHGLLAFNQYYLPVPSMGRWSAGLLFPLPIAIDENTNEGILHPEIIRNFAGSFDSSWEYLLDIPAGAKASHADLKKEAAEFLASNPTNLGRGVHLAARAVRNAHIERDFIVESFNQLGADAFDVALSFMGTLVNHSVGILASQRAGSDILARIRTALATPPSGLSQAKQDELDRANTMLGLARNIAPHEAPYVMPDATRPLSLNKQTDIVLFAMNLWAEAWTEVARYGRRSLQAVAQVVLNRVACGFAGTARAVILATNQFSWTRHSSPVFARAFEPVRNSNIVAWLECLDVAADAIGGTMSEPGIDNADHYYNPHVASPSWATSASFVVSIGNHNFHRLRCPRP